MAEKHATINRREGDTIALLLVLKAHCSHETAGDADGCSSHPVSQPESRRSSVGSGQGDSPTGKERAPTAWRGRNSRPGPRAPTSGPRNEASLISGIQLKPSPSRDACPHSSAAQLSLHHTHPCPTHTHNHCPCLYPAGQGERRASHSLVPFFWACKMQSAVPLPIEIPAAPAGAALHPDATQNGSPFCNTSLSCETPQHAAQATVSSTWPQCLLLQPSPTHSPAGHQPKASRSLC